MIILRLCKEPLTIFVLIASILFSADYFLNQRTEIAIGLSVDEQDALYAQAERLRGAELESHEFDSVLREHIQEELLLKEAYALGFDQDPVIRARMLNKIKQLLRAELPPPDEAELRQYYEQRPELFLLPDTWTFEQIDLPKKTGPSGQMYSVPDIRDEHVLGPANTELAKIWQNQSYEEIAARFGGYVAKAVSEADSGQWTGPIVSPHGMHYIKVIDSYKGSASPFDLVKNDVKNSWFQDQIAIKMVEKAQALRLKYRVYIEGKSDI